MDLRQWASANFFWIQVDRLYENRGPGKPGNQLDCVKGTRAFFGFDYKSVDQVQKHTKLGEVIMSFEKKPETSRSIWFAHNAMDKVHLPVPGWYGPVEYDGQTVRFERVGRKFIVSIGTPTEARRWVSLSKKQHMLYEMGQGRQFGFYRA